MSEFRVAARYAKSVFDLVIELNKTEKIYKDMHLIGLVCSENRNLVNLLNNPIIKQDVKLSILTKIFKKHIDPITLNLLGLICRKNRTNVLPDISKQFVSMYNEYKGIVRANVTSAVSLSAQIKNDFESIIAKETGKKVALDMKVDETLLGGYVLRVGDRQIDDSLKTKLNNLRREFKHRP